MYAFHDNWHSLFAGINNYIIPSFCTRCFHPFMTRVNNLISFVFFTKSWAWEADDFFSFSIHDRKCCRKYNRKWWCSDYHDEIWINSILNKTNDCIVSIVKDRNKTNVGNCEGCVYLFFVNVGELCHIHL